MKIYTDPETGITVFILIEDAELDHADFKDYSGHPFVFHYTEDGQVAQIEVLPTNEPDGSDTDTQAQAVAV